MFVSWMSLSNDTVCDAKLAASYYVGWWKGVSMLLDTV